MIILIVTNKLTTDWQDFDKCEVFCPLYYNLYNRKRLIKARISRAKNSKSGINGGGSASMDQP
jgi:hypothetical protein